MGPGELEPRLDGAVLNPASGVWTPLPDLPLGDATMAPGLVDAVEAGDRLVVVKRVSTEAYALEPGGTEWRSLGPADVDAFIEPVGVAGDRWLFATGQADALDAAAVLDLTTETWSPAAAPSGATSGFLSAGAGDRVLAMAARWSHDTAPPLALSWDPSTDTWTELLPPPLGHRVAAAVAWTGAELLVWGGANTGGFGGPSYADGAALHP